MESGGRASRLLFRHGELVSRYPWTCVLAPLALVAGLVALAALGAIQIQYESDPLELWVPADGATRGEKAFFDAHFGPFFRVEQLIVTSRLSDDVLDLRILIPLLDLLERVGGLRADAGGGSVGLGDLCYRPVTGRGCLVMSPLDFWTEGLAVNRTRLLADPDIHRTASCIPSPGRPLPCQGTLGQPIVLKTILGGVERGAGGLVRAAAAGVVTLLLDNAPDKQTKAEAWEAALMAEVRRARDAADAPFRIAFSTERSVGDELGRMGASGGLRAAAGASFAAMLLYLAFALGGRPFDLLFSRGLLAAAGVLAVAASAAAGVLLCAAAGVKVTPIISQVLPFFLLAIGVDNMFILVHAMDRALPSGHGTPEDRLPAAMAAVGPSIAAAGLAECAAFAIGAAARIPALEALCWMAGAAVLVDLVLQLTLFAAAALLDARRLEEGRLDVVPCCRAGRIEYLPIGGEEGGGEEGPHAEAEPEPRWMGRDTGRGPRLVRPLLRRFLAPLLFARAGPACAVAGGLLLAALSAYAAVGLPLGLDPRVPLPADSYLAPYFAALERYVEVGPPLYAVTVGGDYTSRAGQDALERLKNGLAGLAPEVSPPVFSWFADLKRWAALCKGYALEEGYVPEASFGFWLREFLSTPLEDACCQSKGLCGAPYAGDVAFDPATGRPGATRLRAYVQPLRSQAAYVDAFRAVHGAVPLLPADPAAAPGAPAPFAAFAYSVFFPYYEQYASIERRLAACIALATGAVAAATAAALGSVRGGAFVGLAVGMTSLDLLGAMRLLGIPLNAVSLCNAVLACGLAVEFAVHVARAFLRAPGGCRRARARAALLGVGASVVSGIGATKLLGAAVLAAAPSRLFFTYYFAMLAALVVVGLAHALVFLPALLALAGPPPELEAAAADAPEAPKP